MHHWHQAVPLAFKLEQMVLLQLVSDSQYSGQTSASLYIDNEASKSGSIAGKLTEFIGLIHSTASEFEAVDQKLSQSISTPKQYTTPSGNSTTFQPKPYFN